jgi:hypothetical protein
MVMGFLVLALGPAGEPHGAHRPASRSLDGVSFAEIAAIRDVSEPTVQWK